MKNILGLDLGTNSIGWAIIQQDFDSKQGKILGMGSRIIPMSQDILGDFGKGNSISQTAERTGFRTARRLRERFLLRRERLHRVLNLLGFLPQHYASEIDFKIKLGKFIPEKEPKLAYKPQYTQEKKKPESEFIFKKSFEEMLADFQKHQPQVLKNEKGKPLLIPYDWTIYYLRKKALVKKISKEELAWILLNFNQKRGYYQLRGEEDDSNDKKEYVLSLKVTKIERGEKDKKNEKKIWYNITLNNGWVYSATFTSEPQWVETEKEFLVTEELDENGNIKIVKDKKTDITGKEKRRITPLPTFEEIDLLTKVEQDKIYKKIKAKTEITINNSGKTVGAYIYETLLQNPVQKIRGKLIRTIERKFYKNELKQILETQKEFHSELKNDELYNDCIRELYRNNESHQFLLSKKDFVHLFLDDIIFYQRPLRSQKSSIGNCALEFRPIKGKNGELLKDKNGNQVFKSIKATPKSNPYFQEFRIWQLMYNLSIYKKEDDANVTADFVSNSEDFEKLFNFLNSRKEIEQKSLIKYFLEQKGMKGKALNAEAEEYRWNYVEDKAYPCNETKTLITSRLAKVLNISDDFLTRNIEQQFWHIIYSVTDKTDYEKALKSFAAKYQIDESSFLDTFKKIPPFKSEYGAFSEKAIKRLLPLMRKGKHWSWDAIDEKTKARIGKLTTGEFDEEIKNRIREKAKEKKLEAENDFQGLQLWLAQYIIYGRHSEAAIAGKWNSADDLKLYLDDFKQHSLRNPIVEQVITETLRVVKDIWTKYGNGAKDFFDEIHIELGREMKNTADDRKKITNQVTENENTNLRIKALLAELFNDKEIHNVRPHSPYQQEALKIFEEYALNNEERYDEKKGGFVYDPITEDIEKISMQAQPTTSELLRYKLWLEQRYRSPYTGAIIPLNRLFTTDYQIEHIIPQSRYFDDSFNNKIICEAAVNELKDNQIGLAFIKNHYGETVQLGLGQKVRIFEIATYEEFVKQHYAKNRSKRNKLLMEEIPDKMIERQMNDTRYVSKFISGLLSNIVRTETNDDGVNSKNIIPGSGKITSELKQDWGLNDIWNDLILPRFERLNFLTKTTHFTTWNENHQKYLPAVPLELSKNFSKKRIDHRHHALDALVIACATRDHVNLLNNQSAKSEIKRYDLQNKLRRKEPYFNKKENKQKDAFKEFHKPWETFTVDALDFLENIIVSFKQNLRVINKATNHFEKWTLKDGSQKKEKQVQKGVNWAIRKPMHKATVSGKVSLKWVRVPKGKLLTATRKSLDTSFDIKGIGSITDTAIQKILKKYLGSKGNNPEIAFSPEGIEDLNKNIRQYNNGKYHQPILKVRVFELGNKFQVGQSGNKRYKYVEAAKGTNLFFAIYKDNNGNRSYETVPLNEVIERQKLGLQSMSFENEKGDKLLFSLSPNDLVYVPTQDEQENISNIDFSNLTKTQMKRLLNVNDFSGTCYFTPNRLAKPIASKEVDLSFDETKNKLTGSFDTKTASFEGKQIKEICIKINIDRLGNLSLEKKSPYNNLIEKINVLSESDTLYKKQGLKQFSSLQEMNEADAKEMAVLSPKVHLENATLLTKTIFEEELKKPMVKKIKFK
ncbi:MAG: type II CRISPR RNA-guided endonuclease Cas9 [Chitinophagaceae bacterium]